MSLDVTITKKFRDPNYFDDLNPQSPYMYYGGGEPVAIPAHNQLSNLQGGVTTEYYHLTSGEYQELQTLLGQLTYDSEADEVENLTLYGNIYLNNNVAASAGHEEKFIYWGDTGDVDTYISEVNDDELRVVADNTLIMTFQSSGITASVGIDITGNLDITGTLTVDTINEHTADNGIDAEGVHLEDGGITLGTGPAVDTIETTLTDDDTHLPTSGAVYDVIAAVGDYWDRTDTTLSPTNSGDNVEIDGGVLKVNTIDEYSAGAGVTVDGGLLKDGHLGNSSNYWHNAYLDQFLYLLHSSGATASSIYADTTDDIIITPGGNEVEINGIISINDDSTQIWEDGSDNLSFKDAVTGTKTLAELASGGTPDPHASSHEIDGSDLVDHDNLTNFVANEHIDHSSVSINTGSNSGLSGGGDLTSSRSIELDISNLIANTIIADADEFGVYDTGIGQRKITYANFKTNIQGDLLHDDFSDYVANEHINHTSVSITAGTGLNGGGDISSNRTINLDLSDCTAITSLADADEFGVYDSGVGQRKITYGNIKTELEGDLNFCEPGGAYHDGFSDFVANEHINHSTLDIITGTTSGLSGGDTLTSDVTLSLALNRLTAITTLQTTDYFGVYDASVIGTRRISYANLLSELNDDLSVGGCSFGADNQIPYTNSGGDDFDYSANFTFSGTVLTVADQLIVNGSGAGAVIAKFDSDSTTFDTIRIDGASGCDTLLTFQENATDGATIGYDAGTNTLKIVKGGSAVLTSLELMAEFDPDGAASLYYDNNKKLATAASSVNIIGTNTGDSNIVYLGLYESNGTTRQGYLGFGSSGNDDLSIINETGKLLLKSSSEAVEAYYAGSKKLETTSGGITITGDSTATDFNLASDIRLKENMHSVCNGLDIALQITPRYFKWKDKRDEYEHIGFIAQELNTVRSELVKWNDKGYASISYSRITAINTAAIQDLHKKILELEKEIKRLKNGRSS